MDNYADCFTFMHQVKGIIDFVQRHDVPYQWFKFDLTLHRIFGCLKQD